MSEFAEDQQESNLDPVTQTGLGIQGLGQQGLPLQSPGLRTIANSKLNEIYGSSRMGQLRKLQPNMDLVFPAQVRDQALRNKHTTQHFISNYLDSQNRLGKIPGVRSLIRGKWERQQGTPKEWQHQHYNKFVGEPHHQLRHWQFENDLSQEIPFKQSAKDYVNQNPKIREYLKRHGLNQDNQTNFLVPGWQDDTQKALQTKHPKQLEQLQKRFMGQDNISKQPGLRHKIPAKQLQGLQQKQQQSQAFSQVMQQLTDHGYTTTEALKFFVDPKKQNQVQQVFQNRGVNPQQTERALNYMKYLQQHKAEAFSKRYGRMSLISPQLMQGGQAIQQQPQLYNYLAKRNQEG